MMMSSDKPQALPFFIAAVGAVGSNLVLPEETSKHVVQVLRMTKGEMLRLTDGSGLEAKAVITDDNKKKCSVQILELITHAHSERQHTIAISLLKNTTRFEWFLEKSAELGLVRIVPLICARTEKQHFRFERMRSILISAMLQSQQSRLPTLLEPVAFKKFVAEKFSGEPSAFQGLIAHCGEGEKNDPLTARYKSIFHKTVLIGPEGDFTPEEISFALAHGYEAISLGATRLRTETAGIVAATLLQLT